MRSAETTCARREFVNLELITSDCSQAISIRGSPPVPKAGGAQARRPDDVRPVSVVDDLEVVLEALFLAAVRQLLVDYAG